MRYLVKNLEVHKHPVPRNCKVTYTGEKLRSSQPLGHEKCDGCFRLPRQARDVWHSGVTHQRQQSRGTTNPGWPVLARASSLPDTTVRDSSLCRQEARPPPSRKHAKSCLRQPFCS